MIFPVVIMHFFLHYTPQAHISACEHRCRANGMPTSRESSGLYCETCRQRFRVRIRYRFSRRFLYSWGSIKARTLALQNQPPPHQPPFRPFFLSNPFRYSSRVSPFSLFV